MVLVVDVRYLWSMSRPRLSLTDEQRAARRREQRRDWARRNPEVGREYYQANKEQILNRQRKWREDNVAKLLVDKARRRAIQNDLPCNLSTEYVALLIPERCPVFDIPLEMGHGTAAPNSPSLDRIDPALGYTRGNVQVLSNKANMMKQNATREELVAFAEWVLGT